MTMDYGHKLPDLSKFDGVEIAAVHENKAEGWCERVCDLPAGFPVSFWTVYGHLKPTGNTGGVEALVDCLSEHDAQVVAALIEQLLEVDKKAAQG